MPCQLDSKHTSWWELGSVGRLGKINHFGDVVGLSVLLWVSSGKKELWGVHFGLTRGVVVKKNIH